MRYRRPRAGALALGAVLAVAVLGPPGPGLAAPPAIPDGTTIRVSERQNFVDANADSPEAVISANGRFVAFTSDADNLVPGDKNDVRDLFVKDRETRAVSRAPFLGGAEIPPRFGAADPSISADGRFVAYVVGPIAGTFSVDSDTFGTFDGPPAAVASGLVVVLLWDRESSTTTLVSQNIRGSSARGFEPAISGDGRFVAYSSDSSIIVPGDSNQAIDVFVWNRETGQTVLGSVDPGGAQFPLESRRPALSGDGRYVAFDTFKTTEERDVYVRDLFTGGTSDVSVDSGGAVGTGEDTSPAISADGSVIAFESGSPNLLPGVGFAGTQIFVTRWQSETPQLVSVGLTGGPGSGFSETPAISADGRFVAFASAAADLVPDDTNYTPPVATLSAPPRPDTDVFIRDIVRGVTARASVDSAERQVIGTSYGPSVSQYGRHTAFSSIATTLVPGELDRLLDAFVRDLPPVPVLGPDPLDFGLQALFAPGQPQTAILTNDGWSRLTATGVALTGPQAGDFLLAGDGCTGFPLYGGDTCSVFVLFLPNPPPGRKTAFLEVSDDEPGSPRSVRLVGRAGELALRVEPEVGPPGFVTAAIGEGFPAGSLVRLRWNRGISPAMPPVVVGPDGRFEVGVLVFPKDLLGPRQLIASAASGSPPFPTQQAGFLVVEPTGQPPGFGAVVFAAPELQPIVVRR